MEPRPDIRQGAHGARIVREMIPCEYRDILAAVDLCISAHLRRQLALVLRDGDERPLRRGKMRIA